MEEKQYKLVFNSGVARKMIRDYNLHVADIKADKNNKDKTVFVFERTSDFEKAFSEINSQIKSTKDQAAQ